MLVSGSDSEIIQLGTSGKEKRAKGILGKHKAFIKAQARRA